jgi:hypothetical protein
MPVEGIIVVDEHNIQLLFYHALHILEDMGLLNKGYNLHKIAEELTVKVKERMLKDGELFEYAELHFVNNGR